MPNYKANAAFRERNYPALHNLSAADRVVVPFLPEPLPCVPG